MDLLALILKIVALVLLALQAFFSWHATADGRRGVVRLNFVAAALFFWLLADVLAGAGVHA